MGTWVVLDCSMLKNMDWAQCPSPYIVISSEATSGNCVTYPGLTWTCNKGAVQVVKVNPLGSTIELRFDDFALEERSSRNACYDYVTVTDSDGTESEQFCGNDISSPILSTGNTMILRFYSDYGVERKGFKASWKERKEN